MKLDRSLGPVQVKSAFAMGGSNTGKNQIRDFTRALRRPAWIDSRTRQRSVLVGDGTGSMRGRKAREAERAILALEEELVAPQNKGAFDVAVVRFDTTADCPVPLQPAQDAAGAIRSLKLLEGHGGSTDISSGLQAAEEIVAKALSDGVQQVAPVVLLFSDGNHNTGPDPEPVAERLKAAGVTLVCVAYGSDADENRLRRLASPQCFYRCEDGRALRTFFASVGATLSESLSRGIDTRRALSEIQDEGR